LARAASARFRGRLSEEEYGRASVPTSSVAAHPPTPGEVPHNAGDGSASARRWYVPSIAIFIFPGVEELDFVGPWEVLRSWQTRWPDDGVEVFLLAAQSGPVECAKGMRVLPDCTWSDRPSIDVLVYPGGRGTRPQLGDERFRTWLRDLRADGALITSVCTGALVLADAGLLDHRPATTHWASLEHLARLGTGIEVHPEDRFVDSGEVVTASGVSAGIDMALHLVRRLHSEDRAREVRRYIQYDPQPPV
jgi:transcriptional regulator GlxA family with amidase domain